MDTKNKLLTLPGSMAMVRGWEFDVVTMEGTWTDEVSKIYDLDPNLEVNVSIGLSYFHGENLVKITKAISDATMKGIPYDLELELISARGNPKWVHTIGFPELMDGKVIKVRGILQDISAIKVSQDSLEKNREYIDNLIQTTNAMMVVLDKMDTFWK